MSRIYKLLQLNTKTNNQENGKWIIKILHKRYLTVVYICITIYSTSLVIREMQSKTNRRYQYITQRMGNIKRLIPSGSKNAEQLEIWNIANTNAKWYRHFEKQFGISYKVWYTLNTWTWTINLTPRCFFKRSKKSCPHKDTSANIHSVSFIISKNCKQYKSSVSLFQADWTSICK